jgi:cell division protein FtsN
MAEDARSPQREFQLETRHLAAVLVVIALMCIGAFMLGRWVERQAHRATAEGQIRSGLDAAISVEDVNRELTYHRTLEGEAAPPAVAAPPPEPASPPVRVEAAAGAPGAADAPGIFVQVLATRDADAAEAVRTRLSARGYRAAVAVDPAGAGGPPLRKVKVGPFAGRAEAERAARKIEAEQGLRTWIP